MPYQVISRALETVIKQHNLDIETLMSSRPPMHAGTQTGDSASLQIVGSSQHVGARKESNSSFAGNEMGTSETYASTRLHAATGSSAHGLYQGAAAHLSVIPNTLNRGIQQILDIKGISRNISWEHIESYPIRKKWDGWDEEYSSVDEFKHHLTADFLSSESFGIGGWVFGTEHSSGDHESNSVESSKVFRRSITEKITHVLRKSASQWWFSQHILVQFWAEEEVEGRCCLATLHQPFAVGKPLTKGASWVRKKCMQHYYYIADEDQLGPPGRVFRNGNPESSPDILLYSTKEFPLRDLVTGCGLKSYLASPIFDVHHNQCVGVLECIYTQRVKYPPTYWYKVVDDVAQEVGLRSVHKYKTPFQNLQSQPQPVLSEIWEMLDLAIKSVPQLHLAQVWLPCNTSCMKRKIFIQGYSVEDIYDEFTLEFVDACGFHNIQNGQGIVGLALSSTNKSYFCKNLSEFSITDYPMKHFAQRARFSSCFAICLRNKHNGNDICVFEYFLQPQSRDDASIQSILHLLLKIMKKELKSFEIATERYLGVEYQPLEEHMSAIPMKKYEETFSVLEFKEFFQKVDLSCSRKRGENYGWICWSTKGEELSENRGNDSSMPQFNLGTEGIKLLLSKIFSIEIPENPLLIQFWAPKMIGKRSFLSTSEHPFALSHLQKGLCWYRKQCIQYLYYISDGPKEEELGPPGRVFLNGRPESSPDSRLYSGREFPLRDHLDSIGARTYLALPLFGLLDKQCVGVLEFVGLIPLYWEQIYENLEKYNLRSTHISRPSSPPIAEGKKQALSEIEEMLTLVAESPQLQTASVWIPCSQCAHNNTEISCMERARFSNTYFDDFYNDRRIHEFINACKFHQQQITNGVIRKVIESESKLYFCEDLCSSSICEQPLAHYLQAARLEICFAVCLKSSYTGSSLYVIEFFLSPHSTKYEYSRTLCFLLSIMKQMLKSFKVASGQLLGEELISEVHFEDVSQNITGFSTANQLTVEKSGDVASNIDQEQERNIEGNERDRSSTSFPVSCEQIKSQFGKNRKDAAKNLGVSISTFKRKCRDYDIKMWSPRMNNIKNPSLFRTKVANKCVENADYQTMEFSNTFQVADVVVEAKFKDDTLKFEFCVSWGLEKLMEEVGKRLNLKIGKFKLKYVDDDDDDDYGFGLISLTCDGDLNLYMKSMKSLGKTTVQVLVHLISE